MKRRRRDPLRRTLIPRRWHHHYPATGTMTISWHWLGRIWLERPVDDWLNTRPEDSIS